MRLPQDGCTPAYAQDHPRMCRRCHLPHTPPAGADGPGHRCRQSEPQSQRQEQSAPGAESGKYVASVLVEQKQSHKDTRLTSTVRGCISTISPTKEGELIHLSLLHFETGRQDPRTLSLIYYLILGDWNKFLFASNVQCRHLFLGSHEGAVSWFWKCNWRFLVDSSTKI